MLVIAVTGGIASGKSTVLSALAKRGFPVIDSDGVVAEIYSKGLAKSELEKEFGSSDKKEIALIAFSSREKMRALESILHPRVEEIVGKKVAELEEKNSRAVFIEVPVFFESMPKTHFDAVAVIYCPEEIQRARLKKRGFSLDEIIKRIKLQKPIEGKKEKADFVVENSSSPESLETEIEKLVEWARGLNG